MNSRLGQLLLSAVGLFVMFFLWEIVGRARLAGDAWAPRVRSVHHLDRA